jgi:hypothetical protein
LETKLSREYGDMEEQRRAEVARARRDMAAMDRANSDYGRKMADIVSVGEAVAIDVSSCNGSNSNNSNNHVSVSPARAHGTISRTSTLTKLLSGTPIHMRHEPTPPSCAPPPLTSTAPITGNGSSSSSSSMSWLERELKLALGDAADQLAARKTQVEFVLRQRQMALDRWQSQQAVVRQLQHEVDNARRVVIDADDRIAIVHADNQQLTTQLEKLNSQRLSMEARTHALEVSKREQIGVDVATQASLAHQILRDNEYLLLDIAQLADTVTGGAYKYESISSTSSSNDKGSLSDQVECIKGTLATCYRVVESAVKLTEYFEEVRHNPSLTTATTAAVTTKQTSLTKPIAIDLLPGEDEEHAVTISPHQLTSLLTCLRYYWCLITVIARCVVGTCHRSSTLATDCFSC